MGDACIQANKLTHQQVDAIVELQQRLHIRFGDAAIKLGFLTESDVREMLNIQFDYGSFNPANISAKVSPTLDILHRPQSEAAEAIKRIRSELISRLDTQSNIILAVLSPQTGEGKSHVAASLAIAFAQLNIKTMLIDADLREPSQHLLFGLPNKTGLSTILAKRSPNTLQAIPQITANFWVLGSGPPPPNPIEILSKPRLKNLIESFAQDIAVFIVDTPSAIQWADAQNIAEQTGFALIVARENWTKLSDLKKTKNAMQAFGVELLGTVYNQPPASAPGKPSGLWQKFMSGFRTENR
ncbi:MAG: chain length determinant protein tyrosine kinase epsg [Comamonadaceae bacterium]|nr:MAG: chain length determinant protein tyrosine kinase epsg [Comamonadaceae bacterium]